MAPIEGLAGDLTTQGSRGADDQNLHPRDSRIHHSRLSLGVRLEHARAEDRRLNAASVLEELEQQGPAGQTHGNQHPEQCSGAEDF
jgi:hypothetical protein